MKKHPTKTIAVLLILMLVVAVLPLSGFAAEGEPFKLTIIHINDRHGRTDADPYILQMAKDLKAAGKNVLILDAGDALHGQITANLTEGASMAELMNAGIMRWSRATTSTPKTESPYRIATTIEEVRAIWGLQDGTIPITSINIHEIINRQADGIIITEQDL